MAENKKPKQSQKATIEFRKLCLELGFFDRPLYYLSEYADLYNKAIEKQQKLIITN